MLSFRCGGEYHAPAGLWFCFCIMVVLLEFVVRLRGHTGVAEEMQG